ncbi:MAG: hypothetical protein HQL41_05115 [Alphaproteobacteria bacterium]|nr:hypothetical protein [Alphaproteobacteria bacterium]
MTDGTMASPDPGRAPSTEDRYRKIVDQLLARCSAAGSAHPTAEDLAHWMAAHKDGWSRSTWRQYRAACAALFGPDFKKMLDELPAGESLRRGIRTSALKRKRIPPQDLGRLIKQLGKINKDSAKMAILMLVCGIVTGLRPSEWKSAKLIRSTDGSVHLDVINAKATYGRAHGPCRTIWLPTSDPVLFQWLTCLLTIVGHLNSSDNFERTLAAARKALQRANRTLWPDREETYSFYSCRHQACANWKANGFLVTEIAALMGHRSQDTATTHYGRRSAGRSSVYPGQETIIVRADSEDVARVRSFELSRQSRRALEGDLEPLASSPAPW